LDVIFCSEMRIYLELRDFLFDTNIRWRQCCWITRLFSQE